METAAMRSCPPGKLTSTRQPADRATRTKTRNPDFPHAHLAHLGGHAARFAAGARDRNLSRTPQPYTATSTLNPPYAMRFTSNGIAPGLHIFPSRGSLTTVALTRSRCARDLNTIHENRIVSPLRGLTSFGNGRPKPISMWSATHSRYSSAPWSRHTLPASRAMRRYAARFFFGTGRTYPST